MFERKADWGDGFAFRGEGEMIAAAEVVGKWESRGVGRIPKCGGKPGFGFPRRVFSTTFFATFRTRHRKNRRGCRLESCCPMHHICIRLMGAIGRWRSF